MTKTIHMVAAAIEKACGVTFAQICGSSRRQHIAEARQVFCAALRRYDYTYQRIADIINRTHGSVYTSIRKHYERQTIDKNYKALVMEIDYNINHSTK